MLGELSGNSLRDAGSQWWGMLPTLGITGGTQVPPSLSRPLPSSASQARLPVAAPHPTVPWLWSPRQSILHGAATMTYTSQSRTPLTFPGLPEQNPASVSGLASSCPLFSSHLRPHWLSSSWPRGVFPHSCLLQKVLPSLPESLLALLQVSDLNCSSWKPILLPAQTENPPSPLLCRARGHR